RPIYIGSKPLFCWNSPTRVHEEPVFIVRDMTLTREAQTLRELNLLNLEFIQTVSHEIKSPLMAVLMGADYLMARGTNFDPEQRETLQTIDQGAQRLQELVADLLDLVNFESGHVSLDFELCDLGALASRVIRGFRKLPNIDISLEISESLKPFRFDHRKIHRVLENLVSNAIKYSEGAASVKVVITRDEDQVRIAVSDHGIGIPSEHIPYIWDKFYRVNSPNTPRTSGTGLGLALTKQIVTMHRGRVEVQSEVNRGSTFSLVLPLGSAQ
ncbi:MAG: HAMP domain-containing sensor histidine kinase, partial [Verrucomicrobia bacterium]|nr:HAMP domain-containing sensor histidine kinase [Verrucomicrobiota bacterium]